MERQWLWARVNAGVCTERDAENYVSTCRRRFDAESQNSVKNAMHSFKGRSGKSHSAVYDPSMVVRWLLEKRDPRILVACARKNAPMSSAELMNVMVNDTSLTFEQVQLMVELKQVSSSENV